MKDFTEGNVTKQIIAFALPMLIGNIFQQVYSMADAMVVGRFVGGQALAAVGITISILNFLAAILIGLATGAAVLVSQYFGAKQEDNLKKVVSTSVIAMTVLAFVIGLVSFIFSSNILRALKVPEDIFADALAYLRIILVGMLFVFWYNVCREYMRALGETKRPLYILIFTCAVNIVLDLVFVVVFKMGVAGAAVATIISQGASFALCYLYIIKRMPILRIRKLVFDKKIFKSILKYSIPMAFQLSMTSFANLTITRLINSFGAVAIAGYTAATKIDSFATMPLSSVFVAISTFVAQNMGAGKEGRAKEGFRASFVIMMVVGVVVSAFALIFGKPLIALFVDPADINAAQIMVVGVNYLSIISFFYILFGIFFAFNGFFRGAGDPVIVMILTIVSLTIRAICAYSMVGILNMGPEAVAWSIPVGWGLCSCFAYFYYKKRLWAGKVAV